jgi:hypothetical protein
MTFDYLRYGSTIGKNYTSGRVGIHHVRNTTLESTALYPFTSAYFTVSRSLSSSYSSSAHRYGPTQTEVRDWLSGTANGGGGHSWANTYVDVPTQGYQRWTVPETATYRIVARGGHAGYTDSPDDYMRGVTVRADFDLTLGDKLLIAVGQGVPNYNGDHCNGGGGASWVALGDTIGTALMLLVGNGAGGDTSDGGAKGQPNTSLNSTVTNVGGVSGLQTTPINSSASIGYGNQSTTYPNSGGYLSAGNDVSSTGTQGGGFRSGDLVGGTRSNSTAGYGGFGGGSGGRDEYGSAGGGFTGAMGQDNTTVTGHGSSFIRDTGANQLCTLNASTTTWQATDYTSHVQYQGRVYVEKL